MKTNISGKILICFITCLHVLSHSTRADVITNTCKETFFPNYCTNALTSNGANAKSDLKEISITMLNVAMNHASVSLKQVKDLQKDTKGDHEKQCLEICYKDYDTIVSSIPKFIENIRKNNLKMVYTRMVSNESGNCHDSCNHLGVKIPIKERNDELFNIGSILTDIIDGHLKNQDK